MYRVTNVEIADDGWPVLAVVGIVTILVSLVALPVGCFLLGLMMWLAHILRVPQRQKPVKDNVVVAPADGRIVQIANCPAGSGSMPLPNDCLRLTIRTRLADAQMQTSPVTGHLIDNCLFPGMFSAWPCIDSDDGRHHPEQFDDARHVNERRELVMRSIGGHDLLMVQLATRTARQLVCRLVEGKQLSVGDPIGMARLAGVTDMYIPASSQCAVAVGQHVMAGETILAELPPPVGKRGA